MNLAEGYKRDIEGNNLRNAIWNPWAASLPPQSFDSNSKTSASKRSSGDSDSGSLGESLMGEAGQNAEFAMDASADMSLSRRSLAEFVDVGPIDKCRGYLGIS